MRSKTPIDLTINFSHHTDTKSQNSSNIKKQFETPAFKLNTATIARETPQQKPNKFLEINSFSLSVFLSIAQLRLCAHA